MKKYLVLLLLLLLMANPTWAQSYSADLSCGFNQCLSKCTGLTALSENIAENKIKTMLQEHFSGIFEVYIDAFSAQDLKAGKFQSLEISGESLNIKEFYISSLKLFTMQNFNCINFKSNPPTLYTNEKIGFQAVISQEDLKKTAKGKLYDEILKKMGKDYDFSAFKLDADSIKIFNNKLQFDVNLDASLLGGDKPTVVTVNPDFAISGGKIEKLNISLANLKTSFDKDELSSIFPKISEIENGSEFPIDVKGIKVQAKINNAKIINNKIVMDGEIFIPKNSVEQ